MKKATFTVLASLLVLITGVRAQTVQEGVNHLYAGRVKNATEVFEKLIAANPNNIDAIYWLGQTRLEADEIMKARIAEARKLYEKALQTTNGAPLIKVGMGHVYALAGKHDEARQEFESALTLTRNRKGDDPVIATAIGRALVDAKGSDYKYAVRLLEDAASKDSKNPEILLVLGNAHRKAGEGMGGGPAFQSYKKALEVNPNFAPASLRLAKLFESQKNWDLVLQYLNEAVSKDPNFTLAYYELFYYYFYRAKFEEGETFLKKYIESKLPESDIQDQFLYAQLCWARKDFNCATTKGEGVVAAMGANTKPKVYRLLADAYYQLGDYKNAKKFSDEFFVRKNPDDYNSFDHKLRADIMSQTGGSPDEIFVNYIQGAELDTVLADRVDFLKKAAAYFKERKLRDKEAQIIQKIIDLKPDPTINDYFDLTIALYFSQENSKSRDAALKMVQNYPEQVYGYEWAFNNSRIVDTVRKDSVAVPDALKLFDFSAKDTSKFKRQYISSASYLAIYYANEAKDRDKAIEYLKKWQSVDAANAENIQKNIEILEKTPSTKTDNGSRGNGRTPSASGGSSGISNSSGTSGTAITRNNRS
ncbi:MAG: tetratricopeptide repeat protein [Chitinophagaceae bacterium]